MLRALARGGLTLAAALYATMLVSPAPWAGPQPPVCTPLEIFFASEVEPALRAGARILVLSDAYEVARYLDVVNGAPPAGAISGEALIIGVAPSAAIVAVAAQMQVCTVMQIDLDLHNRALLAAKRGA